MILFINPSSRAETYQSLGDSISIVAREPPLWCRLLASFVQASGMATADILDADAFDMTPERVAIEVGHSGALLVVIVAHGHNPSASTQTMPAVIAICRAVKIDSPEIPVLVVGGHPAALSERTLRETGADFVCTGEGPYAIADLDRYLKGAGSKWRWASKSGLRGLVYWDHDDVCRADPAPNLPLSDMPGGCWHMLLMAKYRSHTWHALSNGGERQPYASIYTSLNCPFSCSFCMIASPFREGDRIRSDGKSVNYYRTWPPSIVGAEIERLVERHNVKNLKIADEMFVLNLGHVRAVCEEIIRRGYGDFLNIWCYGRVDRTEERFLDIMRRAGVRWIALGIEAASNDVRDGVEKADYGEEDIYRTCERIKAHDINIMGNFIVGLPSDTDETIRQTLSLALVIRPEFMNVYGMVTYPGTPLWNALSDEKRNYDWATYAHHGYSYTPAGNDALSPAGIVSWRDEFFRRYFTDEGYLSMVRRKFGERAEVEIRDMTKKPLKRKLLGD